MIVVDPASIEGTWRVADGEAPDIGPMFTLRGGEVFRDGALSGTYSVKGTVLSFTTRERGAEGSEWTSAFTFDLPGPLANAAAPNLFGSEVVRPDRLPGSITTTEDSGFDDDADLTETVALFRVA
jgi:hypothetical protein